MLRACRQAKVFVLVENPLSSRLWSWAPLAREFRRGGFYFVDFDMCAFAAAWKKPTRIATNLAGCAFLGRKGPGHRRHVVLHSIVKIPDEGSRWRTSFAAAYPVAMVRAWAKALRGSAPKWGWRACNEPRLRRWWEGRWATASKNKLPARWQTFRTFKPQQLGWEHATSCWGGCDLATEIKIRNEISEFNQEKAKSQSRFAH